MIIHYMKQRTPEWLQLKVAKVSGTSFSKVLGAKWMEYADVIATERITGKRKESSFQSGAMEDGTILEPFVRAAYEELMGLTVTEVGFLQSEQFPNFGMSPDGVVFIGGVVRIVPEFKCPEPQTHVRYCRLGKIPAEYDDQILSAFVVDDGIQAVDFVSFCPLVKTYPLFIKRANRVDYEQKIALAKGSLIKFFEQVDICEEFIKKGSGFIPSNLEDALWEISEPEEVFEKQPAEIDSWVGFVPIPDKEINTHTSLGDDNQML